MNPIMRALANGEDVDKIIDREALLFAVQRQITCKRSGKVLDVRDAVLLTLVGANGKRAAECFAPEVWDKVDVNLRARAAEVGATIEVIDGRKL